MMTTYTIDLDYGEGGETTHECDTVREALVYGCDWAAEGDWPVEATGEEVLVRVLDDDGEELDYTTWTIPTDDDRILSVGEVIAQRSGEWDTAQVMRVGDDWYFRVENGGDRGAWDRQDGDGVWRERPVEAAREITRSEARGYLLDWGYEPCEVARMTQVDD